VTEGADGIAFTVSVSVVAGPAQLLALVSVTNIVLVFAVVLLNPNKALAGFVPVVRTAVKPASLYQVYVLPPTGAEIVGALMDAPIQYVEGLKTTAGATGTAFTVSVTGVAGPWQILELVSVTKTVVVLADALLKPSWALVGEVPVIKIVDKLTSLYQVYVLPPTGVVIAGGVIGNPTQYVFGLNITAGATGIALTVKVTDKEGPVQVLLLVSVTKTVVVLTDELLKPNCKLVGLAPVVKTVVSPASLYQVYVLPTTGVVMVGGVIKAPTQ
jgi:hypothetical protein